MKLQFDPNQEYQMDAVRTVTDLFEGLPLEMDSFSVSIAQEKGRGLFSSQTEDILAYGNHASLPDESLLDNLKLVQKKNGLEGSDSLQKTMGYPQFSVEMETGTGKTYVYLRTIHELHAKYGYSKFVIVIPGKAIREGTLKNLEITKDHFQTLYGNTPFSYAVYDSKNMSTIRDFAVSRSLSILIINIEAFRKDFGDSDDIDNEKTDAEKGVLFHRSSEKLSGKSPREFIQAVHPIVVIDEPQSVDNTPIAKKSISLMNPLFTLRYSATHRNPYNLIYRLDPIRAYEMRLVKRVSVAEVLSGGEASSGAYVKLLSVTNDGGIKAQVEIDEDTESGPKRKKIKIKSGDDLHIKSKHRDAYEDGFLVGEIGAETGREFITFEPSGITLHVGEAHGGDDEAIKRLQIRKTIEEHFNKELELKDKGIKVLSLFFLDRVANYRLYPEEGEAEKGQYAIWFEEEYERLRNTELYKELKHPPVGKVHDGYFAKDKSGKLKDSRGEGDTSDDESAYNKIMKEKEQLLSLEEPLKFIFSHSALREGWDNPNVFQICTLNQTNATIKKRQEIGRGMRLPVDQKGVRVFDESINKLVVIANESYKDFAKKLQTEYEEDCGVTFGKITEKAFIGLSYEKNGADVDLSPEAIHTIIEALRSQGMIDDSGKLTELFDPSRNGFKLQLPGELSEIEVDIIDRIKQYQLERHIVRHQSKEKVRVNKEVYLSEDFKNLWDRIKIRTTYAVRFSDEQLISTISGKIKEMSPIKLPKVQYVKAEFSVDERGVTTKEVRNMMIPVNVENEYLPDILSYLQRATHLRRKTLIDILVKSERLNDFAKNSQYFMDTVTDIIRTELRKLSVDGIQYEQIAGENYEMTLFKDHEFSSYLNELLPSQKSVYERIPYDSDIERRFAEELENKEQVKLYVKLPSWFTVDTPVGKYNPDWAIVKQDDEKVYFVRETKGAVEEKSLRISEDQKIKCGKKHFHAIGMDDFEVVKDAKNI